MNKNGQYINIVCIEQACKELTIDYDFHDRNKNVLSVNTSSGKLFFANSSTPFNPHSIVRVCEDKEFTQNIIGNKINMPKTLAFFDPKESKRFNIYKTSNSHKEILDEILKSFTLPVIIKKNSGRQGQNVFLCNTEIEIKQALLKIYTTQKRISFNFL